MSDIKTYNKMSKDNLNQTLISQIQSGNIKSVQILLTSPKLKQNADINYKDYGLLTPLIHASLYGHFNIVKYLLTSSHLKNHSNIHDRDKHGRTAIFHACARGYLEIVKYLLTSEDLKEIANINDTSYFGWNLLIVACKEGQLDIVKYLLTFPNLLPNLYHIDKENKNIIMNACIYSQPHIAQYLIIDINMTIDKNTMDWLKGKNEHKTVYEDILILIEKRDLHNKLDNSIRDDKINNKKVKL